MNTSLRSRLAALLCGLGLLLPALAPAQTAPAGPKGKIKVYLVGTFHFNGAPTDVVDRGKTDMSANSRQQELDDIIRRLAQTKADKVFVEQMPGQQAYLDSTYARYRQRQFALRNNEVFQIGFRLADRLNRPRVYCADAPGVFDYGAAVAYARQHGQEQVLVSPFSDEQPDSLSRLIAARTGIALGRALRDQPNETLRQKLIRMNSPAFMQANMDGYMLRLNQIGSATNYVGADLGGEFYKRNMRIYTALLRAVDVQRDRAIVLLVGAGHVSFLRQQLQYNSLFEVQDVVPLLSGK